MSATEYRIKKGYRDNQFLEPTGYSSAANLLEIDAFAEAYANSSEFLLPLVKFVHSHGWIDRIDLTDKEAQQLLDEFKTQQKP